MINENKEKQERKKKKLAILEGHRKYLMVSYNIILSISSCVLLLYYVAFSPYREPQNMKSTSETVQVQPDSELAIETASSKLTTSEPTKAREADLVPTILLAVMLTMASAGAAGGTLSNLRGLFKYSYLRGGLPMEYEQSYYLRPLTGAVTGIVAFFLGYLITSTLSDVADLGWSTLSGRMPYVGIALLAGFASQEFSERMKAVAETLFSQNTLSQLSAEDQLRKLKKMLDEGLIDKKEFDSKRKAVIEKL